MARRYSVGGRFSQPDPYGGSYNFGDPQSMNRYAYTKNDPVNFRDPSGLDETSPLTRIRRINQPVVSAPTAFVAPTSYDQGEEISGFFGSGTEGMMVELPSDPQNPSPNVTDLESRITKMVSNPDCAKFISDLIKGTATAKNPAEFTDALIGFGKIKGFVYGDSIMKAYGFAGGTVHGSISRGDAQVELPTPAPFPVGLSRRGAAEYISDQGRINAETVLHEILHLAGKNVYDDFAFANTVADMRGVKRLDYTGMAYRDAVRTASDYWNGALMGACRPRGPRYEQH
jgi:hypothetical protein